MAKQVPGKEEFWGLVDWFETMIAETGVKTQLGQRIRWRFEGFDAVVVATGVTYAILKSRDKTSTRFAVTLISYRVVSQQVKTWL